MRPITKFSTAFLSVLFSATLGLPLVPAAAFTPSVRVSFDCVDNYGGSLTQIIPQNADTTLTLTSCEGIDITPRSSKSDIRVNGSVLPIGSTETITDASVDVSFRGAAVLDMSGNWMRFDTGTTLANPKGKLVARWTTTLSTNPPQFTFGTAGGTQEMRIDSRQNCQIAEGNHVYGTSHLFVNKAGKYVFRVTGTTPINASANIGQYYHPLVDPVAVLYRSFDPTHPESNIVGCNDDIRDLRIRNRDMSRWENFFTTDGTLISGMSPYVAVKLTPGSYDLVFTSYTPAETDTWALGHSLQDGVPDWEPGPSSVHVEAWGPGGSWVSACHAGVKSPRC